MKELAQRIQTARKAKGLTQEQLAEQIGVSRQAVSKWESGQSVPDLEKLTALSRFFGVTIDSLLREEPAPAPQASSAAPNALPPSLAALKDEAGPELYRLASAEREKKRRPGYWLWLPLLLIGGIAAFYFLFWAR